MDLDIAGRKALLCASNAGLGLACAKAVAAEGVDVVINGRNPEKIRAAQAEVEAVARGRVSSRAGWKGILKGGGPRSSDSSLYGIDY